jgi:hypothetical protein
LEYQAETDQSSISHHAGVFAMPYAHDFSRSVANLDMRAESSGIFTPGIARIELHADKLRRFNEALACVNPAMPAYGADQIAGAARRLLRSNAKKQDAPFIRVRMRRASEIRAVAGDAHWQTTAELVPVIKAIMAYLDDEPNSLFDRAAPVVGNLDCAILVDAAMGVLRPELDDYADFCRYREAEAVRQGIPTRSLAVNRDQWQLEREEEILLERHLRKVRFSHYGQSTRD